MSLTLSCAFATSPQSHEHARIAESLGYERAFFYDSPPLYPDVWVQLCRAAERTEQIGLGPGVLVPSNRHPMTNAAAIATLVDLAGADRVTVAVGSGPVLMSCCAAVRAKRFPETGNNAWSIAAGILAGWRRSRAAVPTAWTMTGVAAGNDEIGPAMTRCHHLHRADGV